ncbi:aspartyl/glutamyl-tRNA amidotransferase subunit A [Verrucomicrobia bacterium SCGC AG-212-E04]|nr:aspartyl/glutamyl-tRNA amidotransferase subunit A [Verrucomicrobia bacterium SCGC AG-212-E04]
MSPQEIPFSSVAALRTALRAREFTPVDVIDALAARIERVDPNVRAYLSYDLAAARAAAAAADVKLPLGGIPIGMKDVLSVRGQPCGCASHILDGYVAPYDGTAVARLRAAGAIPFGRLNMDEFAMGSSTENSSKGLTHNPWDFDRVPGGSSGGSAASVGADLAIATLGSDTGGSIRQPAALCGCVGLKPTYGRVSRYGLVAFASSLDQIGPFTKTVEDSAVLLGVMSGKDPQDSTSVDEPVPDFAAALAGAQDLRGVKLGLPKEYFIEGITAPVLQAVKDAVAHCAKLGAEIIDVSLPHTEHAVGVYYIVATAEASANLARFDGVRYGHRAADPSGLLDHYMRTREEGFGPEVKRRIILGTHVLSSGYHDAYYLRAQKVRTLIQRDFLQAFAKVDAIICPTSPCAAFKLGERSDPLQMYLADIFTIAANLAGIPGISVPGGMDEVTSPDKPLPIGLQFLAPAFAEANLLRIAHVYEQTTEWHKRRPAL